MELIIDHAWGWEPVTIDLIKEYKTETNSLSSGQVLKYPYDFEKGRLIVREMTDLLVLDLVEKKLVTDQMVLIIGYDIENLTDNEIGNSYRGEVTMDHYGRMVPKHAHGSTNLGRQTSSTKLITDAVMELYDRIVDPGLLVRRVTIAANHLVEESTVKEAPAFEQLELFTDYTALEREQEEENARLDACCGTESAVPDFRVWTHGQRASNMISHSPPDETKVFPKRLKTGIPPKKQKEDSPKAGGLEGYRTEDPDASGTEGCPVPCCRQGHKILSVDVWKRGHLAPCSDHPQGRYHIESCFLTALPHSRTDQGADNKGS